MNRKQLLLFIFNIVCLYASIYNKSYHVNQTYFIENFEKQWNYFNSTEFTELNYFVDTDFALITDKKNSSIHFLYSESLKYFFFYSKYVCSQKQLIILILVNIGFELMPCIRSSLIQYIDLSYNKIKNISSDHFEKLQNLHYLDLSHNQLKAVNLIFRFTYDNLPFLFYLTDNKLKTIYLTLEPNRITCYLNISNNENNISQNIKKIKQLKIDYGTFNLTKYYNRVELDEKFKISDWYRVKEAAKGYLYLLHDHLNLEQHPSYKNITNLYLISLRFNKLRFLRKNKLSPYPEFIKIIYLSFNLIEFIDPIFFDEYSNLSLLDLSHNHLHLIKYLELRVYSLSFLNLENNKMEALEYLVLNSTKDLLNFQLYLDENKLSKMPVIKCQATKIDLISFKKQTGKFEKLRLNFNGIKNSNQIPIIKKLDLSNNYNLKNMYNDIFCSLEKNKIKIEEIHLENTKINKQKISCLKQLQIGKSKLKIFYGKSQYIHNESQCRYSEETDCELYAKRIEKIMTIAKGKKNILDMVLIGLIIVDFVLSVILIKMLCFS